MEWLRSMIKRKVIWLALTMVVVSLSCFLLMVQHEAHSGLLLSPPSELTASSREDPLSYSPMLSWSKDTEAVYYEVEFFASKPLLLSATSDSEAAIFRSYAIFQNHYNPPLRQFAAGYLGKEPLYWRVRAVDFNGNPCTSFSELAELWTSAEVAPLQAPVPLTDYNNGNGSVLLYPVYHWLPLSEVTGGYEVEIYAGNPAKPEEAQLLDTLRSDVAELYDPNPRYSDRDLYWRVRGLDQEGEAVTQWSQPSRFRTAPSDDWQVAVLGDSISHGGGHYSYGPEDFEFSWLRSLGFAAINLSESGDTVQMTLSRFERDVLPFHPQYLLILTGSNSLRAGEEPDVVISCLQEMQRRCREHGIRPILLTLPAINPDNIQHVFKEETVPDWYNRFARVNSFIRTQVHIDVAAAFECPERVLPTVYAMDGLHPDVMGKRLMGRTVSAAWPKVKAQADKEWEKHHVRENP
ncbi:Lysophospholipase L1 [Selenomonas ruminantium]|uniref:Lysophospholipase L1 n=2 Tax=Selenomonas ruminantium TaxID=971 RepID=A0A1I3G7N9_SELRU|nr:Lysophospholipase L1 [Selenomonas ruminantium]